MHINNTFIKNDIIMPMYNLLEYSDNYSMTLGSLWNYHRDEVIDSANENNDANNFRINSKKTAKSKSSEYKTKLIGSRYRLSIKPGSCYSIKIFK